MSREEGGRTMKLEGVVASPLRTTGAVCVSAQSTWMIMWEPESVVWEESVSQGEQVSWSRNACRLRCFL